MVCQICILNILNSLIHKSKNDWVYDNIYIAPQITALPRNILRNSANYAFPSCFSVQRKYAQNLLNHTKPHRIYKAIYMFSAPMRIYISIWWVCVCVCSARFKRHEFGRKQVLVALFTHSATYCILYYTTIPVRASCVYLRTDPRWSFCVCVRVFFVYAKTLL